MTQTGQPDPSSSRCAVFVTTRTRSSRLASKPFVEVAGRASIDWVVERARAARGFDAVVACTTKLPEDDELATHLEAAGVAVFRGDGEDILSRWLAAAHEHAVDFFVACDGDDLLVDPAVIEQTARAAREMQADYLTWEGLPFGTAPAGISTRALEIVCALKADTNTEGQARFFADDRIGKRVALQAPEDLTLEEARLTLDYPEDVTFFAALAAVLEEPAWTVPLVEVVKLLRRRPDLVALNAHLQEAYWARFHARYPPIRLDP